MGGSSKASTSSTNTTKELNTSNVDNRVSEGSIGGNANITLSDSDSNKIDITTTDYGAVEGGLSVAMQALDSNYDTFKESLNFASDANDEANDATADAITKSFKIASDSVTDDVTSTISDFMRYGTIIALGGGVIYYLIKKSK